ncbi:MAG TPA: glycoside hydrolase family 3 N-terminal domain-containing protein [Acidimicrobiales bacterium]|nr:glycoside hydrolase family 3 N-terminal domain-containing protein [Acidimicrobiales bacterium]
MNSSETGRAARLMAAMTVEQKVAQLSGVWVTAGAGGQVAPYQGTLAMGEAGPLSERIANGIGQLTRPFGSAPVEPLDGIDAVNALQRSLLSDTPGVAAMVHEECLTGLMAHGATAFPGPLAWGATFDPGVVSEMADAIRQQMRSVGAHQGLAPLLDVVADARWGRVEECIGEDPYLVGVIGCAYIRGLQGNDPRRGVVATAKHFVGYSASEGGRNLAPAHLGPRELADVYLLPFEMAVTEAGLMSVMNSYQEIDGEPVAASRPLLTEILRERWGFDGIVVSDYFSVDFLHLHHGVAADRPEAAALALRAGIDVELPNPSCFGAPLLEGLERGLLSEADVERACLRVLSTKERVGLLDQPLTDRPGHVDLDPPEHRALARRLAERSIILLRNEDGLLPLPESVAAVAVVGPNAASASSLLGNYSFQNHVASHVPDAPEGPEVVTVEEGLRRLLGPRVDVRSARGCEVTGGDRSGFAEAVAAASGADVAVVVLGDQAGHFGGGTSGEGTDSDDLRLPGVQEELLRAVCATGVPTVAVLVTGRPYDLGWVAGNVAGVVQAWFPGEEGGSAVADVLFGRVNPAGRAPVSYSRGAGQQPVTYRSRRLSRSRYAGSTTRPVFPFGHGLSYTTFEYSELSLPPEVPVGGDLVVECTVTNTGGRDGDEVVQLYTSDPVASVTRPVQELKGFCRVAIPSGASSRISFSVPTDLLAFAGPGLVPIVEPGTLEVRVGASSADIRLRGATHLVGETRVLTGRRRLTTGVSVRPA